MFSYLKLPFGRTRQADTLLPGVFFCPAEFPKGFRGLLDLFTGFGLQ